MPTKQWKTTKLKQLADAMMSFKKQPDLLLFLRDLCTTEELGELSNRWLAAQMIYDDVPYRTISEKTGMSTATITRIAHSLSDGKGYRKALGEK